MKRILKISVLILVIAQLSFTKEKELTSNEKKLKSIEVKYHLKRVEGVVSKNVKQFATMEQLEAYLISKTKVIKARTTAKMVKVTNWDGSAANASNSYVDVNNSFFVNLYFDQFRIDGFPPDVELNFTGYFVSSSVGAVPDGYTHPYYQSNEYEHMSGTAANGSMNVKGNYKEYYSTGGALFEFKYKFILEASYSSGTINAYATFQPSW